jgi:type VI secretion system secreted protein VgrG
MNMLVKLEVTVNASLGDVVIDNFQTFVIRRQVFGLNSYELHVDETVIEGDEPDFMKKSAKLIGCKTTVKITIPEGSPEVVFKGIVTNVSCSDSDNSNASIVIKAESPDVLMNHGLKKRVFKDMNLKDIVQKVSSAYPTSNIDLNNSAFGLATSIRTTVMQYNETDYQFLQRLADFTGNWFFHDGLRTHFGAAPNNSAVELKIGETLSYFEVNARAGGIQHEADVYNTNDNSTLSHKTSNPNTDTLTNTLLQQTKNSFTNTDAYHAPKFLNSGNLLSKYLEVRHHQQIAEINTASGTCCDPNVKIGNKIKIVRDGNAVVGEYRVVSLDTVISAEGDYQNNFTGVAFSEHAPRKFAASPEIPSEMSGKVVAVNDPDGLGRIKVRFDWQPDNDDYGWVNVSSPSAGEDSGFYMRPELGDWVIIHLSHTIGLDDCYVGGSLHSGKTKPSRWKHKDNHLKGIRTLEGNEILLEDKGNDGRAISIQTKDDDGNYFWITDKNGNTEIYLRSKVIKLMAENDLEISAGGKLILQGTDVKISSGSTSVSKDSASQGSAMAVIEMKSSGDVKVDSKSKFEVSAMMDVKISANANFSASANMTAEVSGSASSTLKSSGVLTIQGTLVKIN